MDAIVAFSSSFSTSWVISCCCVRENFGVCVCVCGRICVVLLPSLFSALLQCLECVNLIWVAASLINNGWVSPPRLIWTYNVWQTQACDQIYPVWIWEIWGNSIWVRTCVWCPGDLGPQGFQILSVTFIDCSAELILTRRQPKGKRRASLWEHTISAEISFSRYFFLLSDNLAVCHFIWGEGNCYISLLRNKMFLLLKRSV